MKKIDKIGYFKGKAISQMTRDELLDFAEWAGKQITDLQKIADSHMELRLNREVFKTNKV